MRVPWKGPEDPSLHYYRDAAASLALSYYLHPELIS